jgi:hypothetical protein
MKELGFILDEAARSPTGMPSVSADIIHFSKAVFPNNRSLHTEVGRCCIFQPEF